MATFRRCPECKELFKGKRCYKCAAKFQQSRRDKIESLQVYRKQRWKDCRRDARLRWLDYDIWALGEGRVVKLDKVVVHHIYEREERPELCYDIDNLITVSYDSHAEIHKMYETDRAAAMKRIQAGIDAFKEVIAIDS